MEKSSYVSLEEIDYQDDTFSCRQVKMVFMNHRSSFLHSIHLGLLKYVVKSCVCFQVNEELIQYY